MRKVFFITVVLIFVQFGYGQESLSTYSTLKKSGDSLYRIKEFTNAAKLYSQILRLKNIKSDVWDFNRAAFAWSRAGIIDSSFDYLFHITQCKEISFGDYINIVDDRDYKSLQTDSRWKEVSERIFFNAQNSFNYVVSHTNGREKIINQIEAVYAWAFNKKNLDSAIYFLNIISESPSLEFAHVQNLLTEGYTDVLLSDKRWKQVTRKMFVNLIQKYIPKNSFSKKKGNRIAIDEGHHNLHNIKTTYITLSGVLNAAGLKVEGIDRKFNEQNLSEVDLLIISNPLCDISDSVVARSLKAKQPFRWSDAALKSAYSQEEAIVIEHWVKNGGSLFLILDHAPYPSAGQLIAKALNVEIRNVATYDKLSRDPDVDTATAITILFTRSKSLIGKHPIMNLIDSVTTATGSSLVGPPNSETLLYLPATATDQDWLTETPQIRTRSAAGRTQGVAFKHGKGRVVVLGEASMLNSDLTSLQNRGNWKMTLNIFRWLTGNLQ